MAVLDIVSVVNAGAAVPQDLQDQWFNGLTLAAAGKIPLRWNAIVGSDTLWAKNVAVPSGKAYQPFPDAAFVSKRGRDKTMITGLQQAKLAASQLKAKTAYDLMFANGGANFTQRVNDKAGNYTRHMPNTLALTGARVTGHRGPASIHVRGIASDVTLERDIGGDNTYTGIIDPLLGDPKEYRYVIPGLAGAARAALEGMIIQTGVLILQGVLSDVSARNVLLTTLLKAFLHPGYVGASTIGFAVSGTAFTLTTHLSGDDPFP